MFFASKIRAVAEAVGAEISFPRTREALIEKARRTRPRLILVDLHNQKIDSRLLASELKADEGLRDIPLMGFFSHVQTELQRDALAAGFDRVLPRSQFSKNLPELLTGVLPAPTKVPLAFIIRLVLVRSLRESSGLRLRAVHIDPALKPGRRRRARVPVDRELRLSARQHQLQLQRAPAASP